MKDAIPGNIHNRSMNDTTIRCSEWNFTITNRIRIIRDEPISPFLMTPWIIDSLIDPWLTETAGMHLQWLKNILPEKIFATLTRYPFADITDNQIAIICIVTATTGNIFCWLC